jgi:HK97 family phage prohead protease
MIAPNRAEFEGYGAVFGEADLTGDVIVPGAFSRRLIPAARGRIRMLYQHRSETVIGRWTDIREDQRGLLVRGEIFLDTGAGRDVHALLEGGAVDGLSIGFRTRKAKRNRGVRMLTDIDLWEVSVVTFPMAPSARITRVAPPGERLPRNLLSA